MSCNYSEIYVVLIELIGESELAPRLRSYFELKSIKLPIKRPKRGSYYTNIVTPEYGVELVFSYAQDIFTNGREFKDGELILSQVFFRPLGIGGVVVNTPPYLASWNVSRGEVRAKFGPPYWSSPLFNNDKWDIDGLKMLIEFDDSEACVSQLTMGLE